jgi:rSAM/selenodomain-associated transferase 1
MSRARAETCGVAVFARAPVAGAAKTRLIPMLGAEGAASLHGALLSRTLGVVSRARAEGHEIGEVTLCCAPDTSHPVFTACREEFGIALLSQAEGDLGRRMRATFEAGPLPLLLIGSDCPVLTPELLRECAAEVLGGRDAVFLPAEDGGYGLVGLSRPAPRIFENIAWSTARVMEETRQRLREAGLAWSEPATIWDVDRPADVERLIDEGLLPEWRKAS